jgi:sugar (pentulose or hexulose) kinase
LSSAGARLLDLPAGLPVAVGAADSVAGALAMSGQDGGLETGSVSLVMGSGTVIIDAVRERRLDPGRRYLLTPHARAGWYGREMDVLATGSGFRWLGRLLGRSDAEIEAAAAASPPGARGLFFAPYLAGGEQGALWDPRLSGVLHGLSLHHGPDDIARAFIEGAQFEIRRCLEVLAEAEPVRRIVLAGHRAASPASLQMLADILARPVEAFPHLSPAAVGAALLARPSQPASRPARIRPRVEPGAAAAHYEAIYRRYLALFPRAALPA